jgi:acyl-CoA reductase-like NAD-dependent aldehyde dehydrogenase
MTGILKTVSPIDGSVCVERPLSGASEVAAALTRAQTAQRAWATLGVERRAAQISRLVDAFVALKPEIAREITLQMGRPIRYTPNEVGGFEERARYMIASAPQALVDLDVGPKPGFRRFIRRVPLGVALVVAP